jgi:hypothetical protein
MQPDVIFQHLGHQAVDSAAHVGQQHQNVGTVITRAQRTLDRIHLSANPLDASH